MLASAIHPRAGRGSPLSTSVLAPWFADDIGAELDALSFAAVRAAYERSGGVRRSEELARCACRHELLGFDWHGTTWLPMAQLVPGHRVAKAGFRKAWDTLAAGRDGWQVAAWFARRNVWLAGRRPVDLVDIDLRPVLCAAQAARLAP